MVVVVVVVGAVSGEVEWRRVIRAIRVRWSGGGPASGEVEWWWWWGQHQVRWSGGGLASGEVEWRRVIRAIR